MTRTQIKERAKGLLAGPRGQTLSRWGRRVFMLGIVAVLFYQMSSIGWGDIVESFPRTPWFYLIFVVIYFSLPLSEAVLYRQLWHFHYWDGFMAFLKKRVLNKDVLGYSGDVYLYLWARERVGRSEREVRGAVKDNAIVSSVASTFFAVLVLGVLWFSGQIAWSGQLTTHPVAYAVGIGVIGAVGAALAVRFRRALFTLPGRILGLFFGIHVGRLLLTNVLQVVQWAVVLPEAAWKTWFTLLAVLIVTSRIPVLPARDLIFIGAGVELSRMLDVSAAGVAGMLLVASVMDKMLNFLFFILAGILSRRLPVLQKDGEEPALNPARAPEAAEV